MGSTDVFFLAAEVMEGSLSTLGSTNPLFSFRFHFIRLYSYFCVFWNTTFLSSSFLFSAALSTHCITLE